MRDMPARSRFASSFWFEDTVAQAEAPAEEAPPSIAARLQWLSAQAAFLDTGGMVSGDVLAHMLSQQCEARARQMVSQPVSVVARWIVARDVVTVDSPWGPMLPVFQFDLPNAAVHPAMSPLLAELRGVLDDRELAMWFVTPNEWLGGACPARAMRSFLPAVRMAARTDRYVALGG